tara:strand:+ start:139 stop:375 length:237 start_codon:yes stop_codon:yes gene_type:complete
MFYQRSQKEVIAYHLKTDPPEAMYWSTYKLKPEHIVLVNYDRGEETKICFEIYQDIIRSETCPDLDDSKSIFQKVRSI